MEAEQETPVHNQRGTVVYTSRVPLSHSLIGPSSARNRTLVDYLEVLEKIVVLQLT